MGLRQKEWARKARRALIAQLGGVCVACGTAEDLELDCIIPRGDEHHRLDTSARISFYRREAFAHSNVQLLCSRCHAFKSAIDAKRRAPSYLFPCEGNTPTNCLLSTIKQ